MKINKLKYLTRNPSWKWYPAKKKEHWKPKKTKGPDVGTYEHHESIKRSSSMKKITYSLPFGGGKGSGLTTKEKKNLGFKDKAYYLQKSTRDKKFIPGVGHYK